MVVAVVSLVLDECDFSSWCALHVVLPRLLGVFGRHGVLAASLGSGSSIASLSSVTNNTPTVPIVALPARSTSAHGAARQAMADADVVGADLGPTITPIGSLVTLLWLHVVERNGTKIGWGR